MYGTKPPRKCRSRPHFRDIYALVLQTAQRSHALFPTPRHANHTFYRHFFRFSHKFSVFLHTGINP